MNAMTIPALTLALLSAPLLAACATETRLAHSQDKHHDEQRKIVVTSPVAEDVVTTRPYVAQIHSRRHIEIRALDSGYLQEVNVQEGQAVKHGQVMFRIVPILYQAKMDSEAAEAEVAQIRYNNTKVLGNRSVVSDQEVALAKAELARAKAKFGLAQAEFNFAALKAPFDGIVDRQRQQQGSLVNEGDVLSTLSDNQVMWVYFNVPEARYLEYKTSNDGSALDIQLKLANGDIFPFPGKVGAIEADFDNETGNIAFRADFANPNNLLRHGQTGTILIRKKLQNAIVIPQRATFEILANKYVFVVEPEGAKGSSQTADHGAGDGHHGVVRQRQIEIAEEMDDVFVIKSGLSVNDKIIFEGVRQVRDGDKVEYELRAPKEILANLKNHAE
jgi:membrane fusion protein, multidrug efflux system